MSKMEKGSSILIEEAWEDEAGHYHDEYATVSRIASNGALTIKVTGHSQFRNSQLSAWINKGPLYTTDLNVIKS